MPSEALSHYILFKAQMPIIGPICILTMLSWEPATSHTHKERDSLCLYRTVFLHSPKMWG